VAAVNAVFPDQLQCLPHESPTVLVVTNFRGDPSGRGGKKNSGPVKVSGGGTWHTDIEYEPLPIYVSMFLVHRSPISRDASGGTWVEDPGIDVDSHPYLEGSSDELNRLRKRHPLNGETAFSDTAAAFAALPGNDRGG
jgi:alpha-ketoglutarate-dependent taurine dioxygenase